MSTRKRRYRSELTFSSLPEIPKLSADVALEVFTHKSLRVVPNLVSNNSYGDNERLAVLGGAILELVVVNTLQQRFPILDGGEIELQCAEMLSDSNIELFCQVYHLRDRLRCLPDVVESLSLPSESRALFYSYVGGIYVDSGMGTVQNWISHLLPESTVSSAPSPDPGFTEEESILPAKKRTKTARPHSDSLRKLPSRSPSIAPPPSRDSTAEPVKAHPTVNENDLLMPLFPASTPLGAPIAPASLQVSKPVENIASNTAPANNAPSGQSIHNIQPSPWQSHPAVGKGGQCLPVFNQVMSQRRLPVEWHCAFEGPAHKGTWIMQCVVKGVQRGYGKGPNKAAAKEDAARQAWAALWGDD